MFSLLGRTGSIWFKSFNFVLVIILVFIASCLWLVDTIILVCYVFLVFCVKTGSLFPLLVLILAVLRSHAWHFDFTTANSGPSLLLTYLVCNLLGSFSFQDLLYTYRRWSCCLFVRNFTFPLCTVFPLGRIYFKAQLSPFFSQDIASKYHYIQTLIYLRKYGSKLLIQCFLKPPSVSILTIRSHGIDLVCC